MACPNPAPVDCHAEATCAEVMIENVARYTCRCNANFKGDGFKLCELDTGLPETYLLAIILVCLLFVALLVVVVFLLCKRRLSGDGMRQQLVGTMEVTAYESKWENVAAKDEEDGPPPYEEKKAPEPDAVLGTFTAEVTQGRVPVGADDEDVDQTDDAKEFDNPSYDTIANAKVEAEADADVAGIDNPVYDADLTPAVSGEVEVAAEVVAEVEPVAEVAAEVEVEAAAEVEVAAAAEDDEEKAIAVTFTEGELPNTVSAHVSTPEASLTINLNISLPDTLIDVEE